MINRRSQRNQCAHTTTLALENLESRHLMTTVVSTSIDATPVEDSGGAASSAAVLLASPDSENGGLTNASTADSRSDVVLDWNNLFTEILVANEDLQNPGYASRSMAMMNLAIHDAVTIVVGRSDDTFYSYQSDIVAENRNVTVEVVASQAARTVLSSLYSDQVSTINAFRDSVVANHPRNASSAITLGTHIGEVVLASRANDGSDAVVHYEYDEGAGYFQSDPLNPDVPVWGPGWGQVETFVISSAENYVPASPPSLSSREYANSYEEVLALGSVDSAERTADQTEAGIFWAYDRLGLGTPLALYNKVVVSIATQEGNSLEENASLFAKTSVSMADAAITAWNSKFEEDFWRPVTAIREGDDDGNRRTDGDSEWTALGAPDGGADIIGFTPPFPTYISGHATFGGALFGSLREFYGTDDISFELTSGELEILMENPSLEAAYGLDLDDAVRSFDSLSEAMAENGRSRVYLGIHFDFDDLVGQEVGQEIAEAVARDFADSNDRRDTGSPDRQNDDGRPQDENERRRRRRN